MIQQIGTDAAAAAIAGATRRAKSLANSQLRLCSIWSGLLKKYAFPLENKKTRYKTEQSLQIYYIRSKVINENTVGSDPRLIVLTISALSYEHLPCIDMFSQTVAGIVIAFRTYGSLTITDTEHTE